MLRFVLMRHGQSEADLPPKRLEGNADFPLTDLGRKQAELLADRIREEYSLDLLISSPLQRARQTADAIAAAVDLPVLEDARLSERSYGRLAGMTLQQADEQYPLPAYGRRVHESPPEGESYLQQYARVAEFWFSLYYDDAPRTVGVVTHGGSIQCLYHAALGLPPLTDARFACGDTCVHEWVRTPSGNLVVKMVNSTYHLNGLS